MNQKTKTNEFAKKCPQCGKEQTYCNKYVLKRSILLNTKCMVCSNSGENNPGFGKTRQFSEEHKKNISKAKKGKKFTEKHKKALCENHADFRGEKSPLWGKPGVFTGRHHRTESKLIMRQNAIKRIEENNGQLTVFYNKKACEYFNQLMEQTGNHIQHAENGGEFRVIGYFVDGYDVKNNIVYEYDEKHHFNSDGILKEKDIQRQREIEEFLGCTFIRIKEQ